MKQQEHQVERWTLVKGDKRKIVLERAMIFVGSFTLDPFIRVMINNHLQHGWKLEKELITKKGQE